MIILILYIIGLFSLVLLTNDEPLYISNMSYFSQYKYIILAFSGLIFVFFIIIKKIYKIQGLDKILYILTRPYLNEETTKIFSCWEEKFFGSFFNKICIVLSNKNKKHFFLLIIHIFLQYLVSFLLASTFLYVCFFHKDIRLVLLFLPLSFIAWLYRHLAFYFFCFVEINFNAIKEYLQISITESCSIKGQDDLVLLDYDNIVCQLSPLALSKIPVGINPTIFLEDLKNDYVILGQVKALFIRYNSYVYLLPYITFGLRYVSWVYISFLIFFDNEYIIAVKELLTRLMPKAFSHGTRAYSTKAYMLNQKFHKKLEAMTEGAYAPGHPVTTDTDKVDSKGNVPFYHQPTHGKGSSKNTSKLLNPTADCKGDPKAQNAVYPQKKVEFPISELGPEIKGSEEFYKSKIVSNNDMKNRGGTKDDYEN